MPPPFSIPPGRGGDNRPDPGDRGSSTTADFASTTEDDLLNLDVLANDRGKLTIVPPTGLWLSASGASISLNADGTLDYDPRAAADIQALAAGEPLIDTFTYTVEGRGGQTWTETVTVTITGMNDAPIIDSGPQAGAIAESANSAPAADADPADATGTITFDDAELSDVPLASITAQSVTGGTAVLSAAQATALLDNLALGAVVDNPDGSGSVGWTYGVANSEIDFLDAGETVELTFTVTVDDQNGGTASQDVVITITGASDAIPAVELSEVKLGTDDRGFVINGVSAGDRSGYSVSSAGDVNGDGLDDLIVGALRDDPNGNQSGASFVVFGKTDGGVVELSDVQAGVGGFVINGVSAYDYSGVSVSAAGDVNGDGLDDLIVGARGDAPNGTASGASFVVFGKKDGGAIALSDVGAGTGNGGFVINGVSAGDVSGFSVSAAGDVNGDGLDDLIVGAHGDGPNGNTGAGASFVVFGKTDSGAVELSDVEAGSGGFVINGVAAFDQSGFSVSSAGDVNGDGLDDLIVGARNSDPSFVVFGKADGGAVELSDVEAGSGGFVINGVSGADFSGFSVSSAGDVNGDGLDDLIVGAYGDDPNGNSSSGASFVVFGKTDSGAIELSDVEAGSGGFVINGVSAGDFSGFSVSTAGDVNGDGLDDLIVGAPRDDPNGNDRAGASFVVFGKTDGGAVELSDIEAGSGGFVINGASALDGSGHSVSAAGDVNGDGFDDLVVGAPFTGAGAGASFVVFGGNFSEAATQVGSTGDDTLTGSAAADVLVGGTGNDVLDGQGGADVLRAGAGDDVLAVADLGFEKLDGGTGRDVLRLDGAGLSLDLTQIADPVIDDIEVVDLDGGGNEVVLDRLEVLRLSGSTNTVRVLGDGGAGDAVRLVGTQWGAAGTVTDAEGTFDVFSDGLARVEILQGLALTGGPVAPIKLSEVELGTDDRGFVINGVSGNDRSGYSVSTAGDVNGDGFDDLIVGARDDDPNDNSNAGASFVVFGKTDGGVVELSDVETGSGGFVINGASAGDFSGRSVSTAGDVNGDGLDDLIVGAPHDDPNGNSNAGASFVVFGKTDGVAVELSDIAAGTGSGGFVINGVSAYDFSGFSVSTAGDVNGDGLDDLIVGANGGDPNGNLESGASFVVFGKRDSGAVELSDVEAGSGGFVINGATSFDRSGGSVSAAGDVNGDGLDDLIVGAPGDSPNGSASGASFVVFGKAGGDAVELADVEAGSGGFVINGVSRADFSGHSVSTAGDVNGDGLDDLIVGAYGDDPNGNSESGASFVVFGKADGGAVELSDIEAGSGGFVINGVSASDGSGYSVSTAGDVNGDGLDDLIVGAPYDNPNGNADAGASFVVFGKADGGAVELSDIEAGSGGFVINGISDSDLSGYSVSTAGDVNGDGLDDLIVGAPYDNPNGNADAGASFVVFGKTDGGAVELSDVQEGRGGFVIEGVSRGDYSGASVSAAGDVNGDGFDDLIVGARGDDPNGNESGASFVVFGGNFSGFVTQVGTTGDDTLTGSAAADVIFAGTGDDTIDGGGGVDRLSGGEGDDVFVFSNVGSAVTVIDFEGGAGAGDQLDVSAFGFASFADFQAAASASGPGGRDTMIQLDVDDTILLEDFEVANLHADDVLL